ncbi:BsuPI-related putative proteinase inhibitor [Halorarum salinum]|uniref:Intracellular proteinase inhibitor BsuPI domain-containing protein n=1 Tax=Halorarum salinum TaxID=2743089 RepID=A0A7D5LAW0_9EURY|nr:BsuPI-related putative proteinase inhibitor [Halobaculum salinum]QLG62151.1 hypothetical protein HUG12_10570 [Halobaculum salinum]
MLDSTLTVTPTPDGFDLTLAVENAGGDAVELPFSDGQRAEFVAERGDEEVWRWSDDRGFTMALGSEELAPGEAVSYDATFPSPDAGEYEVRAWLTTTDADARAESAATTTLVVE